MRIELTPLTLTAAGWRRAWPFHSTWQLQSYLLCVPIGGLARLFWDVHMINAASVAGGFAGSLPSVFMAQPARFGIGGPGRAQARALLEARLPLMGLERSPAGDGEWVYARGLPAFLRWEEQRIHLAVDGNMLWVSGHYALLLALRKTLRKAGQA
jgi:hypothetical protein